MRLSDEEYVFRKDIQEKKSIGRGAFHKKNGSKSKKCNFPSDYMTKKEREAMNGEVISYNPNAWYTWEEFKALPMEYQVKYVNSLLNKYGCGLSAISTEVFGNSPNALKSHFKNKDQLQYINMSHQRGGAVGPKGKKKLADAIKAGKEKPCQEIQNGSVEEAAEPTLEEKVVDAIDTVTLFASNNVPMPSEKIDEVFIEKTGMTRKDAEKAIGIEWDNPGEPVGNPEHVEDSTDVQSFSIIMNRLDQGVINYIRDLFGDKNIVVSIEVKEVKE